MNGYFICTYYSDFILGGIESYFIRMFKWANENDYKTYLILPLGKKIHAAWLQNLKLFNVVIGYFDKTTWKAKILTENGKEILFLENMKGIVIAADIFSYVKMLYYKEKYGMNQMKILLYIFATTFCRVSKKRLIRLPYNRVIKKISENSIIFMDEDTEEYFKKIYNYKNYKGKIIRLGMEILKFSDKMVEEKLINKKQEFNILTISRMDFPFKSYILGLLDTYNELKEIYTNMTLTIVGDGADSSQVYQKIEGLSSYKKKDIEMHGDVPYEKLQEYFKKAHVYVGMGTTLLDAANWGVPGIISKAYCKFPVSTGFFFEQYNDLSGNEKINQVQLKEMKELIKQVINSTDKEYKEICKESYNTLNQYYSIDKNMRSLLKIKGTMKICRYELLFLDLYGRILKKVQELNWK